MSKIFSKMPSAMALQRGVVITDAVLHNVNAGGEHSPVLVVEHGIRGTQNVNSDKGAEKDIANIQRTESAKLDDDAVAMLAQFDLRSAPLSKAISMCVEPGAGEKGREAAQEVRRALDDFVERSQGRAIESIALRYARNIFNARWLWRNRTYAKAITVKVYTLEDGKASLLGEQDAIKTSTSHFDNPTDAERSVAQALARGWEGDPDAPGLRVEAHVDFGVRGSIEVFPSQNYMDSKDKGFARSLYKHPLDEPRSLGTGFKACGLAAIRDQKVGNALRTIDTWYESYDSVRLVTPVEPMAASLEAGMFLRAPHETAFSLLKSIESIDPESPQGQFLLAIMIRGGVFGEKGEKEDAKSKGKGASGGKRGAKKEQAEVADGQPQEDGAEEGATEGQDQEA